MKTNKQTNKWQKIALLMLGFIIFSCQDDTNLDKATVAETPFLINFKGLPVNHRFATPIEDLQTNHTEGNLKIMYNKAKNSLAKKNGSSYKTIEVALPSPEIIVAATNSVIDQFPYENNNDENSSVNMTMIENDFPTLTSEEIANNIEIIDDYYSQNIDYVVLNEAAKLQSSTNKSSKTQKTASGFGDAWCTLTKFQNPWNIVVPIATGFIFKTGEFSYVLAVYSLYVSQADATTFAEQEYGTTSDNKGDAYKHLMWSSLLAHNYFTVSSKSTRLRFSEAISYAYEDCSINKADAREMDYHNNYIGRKLWDDNCGYRKIFGRPVGLRRPDISTLKTKAKALLEAGVFIDDKIYLSLETRVTAIKNTNMYQVVYLEK
jgi:hypothetical protein